MRHIRWIVIFLLAAVLIVVYTTGDFKNRELKFISPNTGQVRPPTFEELLTRSTHVFYATFKGVYINHMGYMEYKFRVYKTLKGKNVTSIIYVHGSAGGWLGSDGNKIKFNRGKKYLLIAFREKSLFNDHDLYYTPINSVIPLDNLKSSTLNGDKANTYSYYDFNKSATVDSLTRYISKVVSTEEAQNVREYFGFGYIESNKLSEIIKESEYICQVKILELYERGYEQKYEVFNCEMIKPIYGDFGTIHTGIYFKIKFIADTVRPGEEYIVIINKISEMTKTYYISSKRSVRSVREYNRIVRLVNRLKD
jgi:hypothetical protein